jgi:hypothetical protein
MLYQATTGSPVEKLFTGDVYLTATEAVALAPLLARAVEVLRTGRALHTEAA